MLPEFSSRASLKEIVAFTYPRLYKGKSENADWYIGFYAFDPVVGQMRRKRIKINYIRKTSDRKRYASTLINRISKQLDGGWNPWIEQQHGKAYHRFTEVCQAYRSFITRMYNDGKALHGSGCGAGAIIVKHGKRAEPKVVTIRGSRRPHCGSARRNRTEHYETVPAPHR